MTRASLGVGAVVVAGEEGLVSTCLLAPNIAGILLLHKLSAESRCKFKEVITMKSSLRSRSNEVMSMKSCQ